ncbi:MAG TPA: site-2 protease family protein [Planctomycetaceae bacterium]
MADEPQPDSESVPRPSPTDGLNANSEPGARHLPVTVVRRLPRRRLALILFLVTCASTFYAGIGQFAVPQTTSDPVTGKKKLIVVVEPETHRKIPVVDWRPTLFNGLTYAMAVMIMLGAHEAGHYLQARRYHVPASLPLFIPMPVGPLGTMGAVIFQQPGVADRKSLFDIAISGPLAGLAVALPLNWWGIRNSKIVEIEPESMGWTNPRIVEWMVGWIHRPLQPGEDIALNPILFAGWVGIFITGLNLVPIGQLDGGHLLYCLIGKRAHLVARALYAGAIGFVVFQVTQGHYEYGGWSLMLILLWWMGTRHPPTANDDMPLGTTRIVLGWLTLAFVLVGLVSTPMYVSPAPAEQTAPLHDAGLRRLNGDLTATIEGILSRQAAAWNSGDIDGFMQHYWKSDELTFSSGGKTTRGWETTKKNYQQRYPTRERMGHLSFEAIEITSLGDSSGLVLGRWHLQREPAPRWWQFLTFISSRGRDLGHRS